MELKALQALSFSEQQIYQHPLGSARAAASIFGKPHPCVLVGGAGPP